MEFKKTKLFQSKGCEDCKKNSCNFRGLIVAEQADINKYGCNINK